MFEKAQDEIDMICSRYKEKPSHFGLGSLSAPVIIN
jgi:hypothetical protein